MVPRGSLHWLTSELLCADVTFAVQMRDLRVQGEQRVAFNHRARDTRVEKQILLGCSKAQCLLHSFHRDLERDTLSFLVPGLQGEWDSPLPGIRSLGEGVNGMITA